MFGRAPLEVYEVSSSKLFDNGVIVQISMK